MSGNKLKLALAAGAASVLLGGCASNTGPKWSGVVLPSYSSTVVIDGRAVRVTVAR